jgi:hypothetical protein
VSAGDEMVKDCSLETSAPRSAGSVSSGLAEDEPEDSVVIWLGLVGRLEALLELDDVGLGWQVFRELRVQQPGVAHSDPVRLRWEVLLEEFRRRLERQFTCL